jgi:serine/threonine protein kinase
VLTDFSRDMDPDEEKPSCRALEYYSPEALLQKKNLPKSVDWWSIGILTFELMSGHAPYQADDSSGLRSKIFNKQVEFPPEHQKDFFPVDERFEYRSFVERLLDKDPETRMGSKDGLKEI